MWRCFAYLCLLVLEVASRFLAEWLFRHFLFLQEEKKTACAWFFHALVLRSMPLQLQSLSQGLPQLESKQLKEKLSRLCRRVAALVHFQVKMGAA